MYNATTEQFATLNRANVEQATKLAAVALQNAEKIFNANLEAAKFALAQGAESAAAAATVKDVQELMALPARYAETGVQGALGYSRNLYEIASQTQAQFTAVAEETFAFFTKGMATWVDKASENAPAGSDVAVNAFKSSVAATSAAIDQFQRATKQVVSLADASVRAAAENATKAATNGSTAKTRKAA
ncbi:MAG: phasin family protein [Pseudomonadota bacterium]|nr:phasin family protein [Pseudomonadota bacterium]